MVVLFCSLLIHFFSLTGNIVEPVVAESYVQVDDDYLDISWNDLAKVKFEEKYIDELGQYILDPIFSKSVKELDGKKVRISGYAIPLEETSEKTIIVLSGNPFSSCFFCGAAGPETIMDIVPKKNIKGMKMDSKVTFQGTLHLNADDYYSLFYILKDAEVVVR